MQAIWPDVSVEESNLTHNISQIRRALGDGEHIETIPRRGYRFVSEVQIVRREAQGGKLSRQSIAWENPFSSHLTGSSLLIA
jgi:DNA-binding winged helix-turn-helix (wHTH) protein